MIKKLYVTLLSVVDISVFLITLIQRFIMKCKPCILFCVGTTFNTVLMSQHCPYVYLIWFILFCKFVCNSKKI